MSGWLDKLVAAGATTVPGVVPEAPDPISIAVMVTAGVERRLAIDFVAWINNACREFDIVTPQRAAYFLAQIAWESDDFKALREIWGPTQAQLGYENRKDLGNDKPGAGGPGNGRRWCGHGLIQITGYHNHLAVANYFSVSIEQVAAWLMLPEGASRSAAMYWFTHGCNELADRGDFTGVTRKINGGINGLAGRQAILAAIAPSMGIAL